MTNIIVFHCVFQKTIWFCVCFDRWITNNTLIVEFIYRIIVSFVESGIMVLHISIRAARSIRLVFSHVICSLVCDECVNIVDALFLRMYV